MILIVNICKHELHYFEFVRPIEDILKRKEAYFVVKHYSEISQGDIDNAHRIIITGTSLQDFDYEAHIDRFEILRNVKKPVLAICGGMQAMCRLYGCGLGKGVEIGSVSANFMQEFLGVKGEREVYALHNMFVKDDDIFKREFVSYATTKYIQAAKHRRHPYYCVLFHPEVRNKGLIEKFLEV